MENRYEDAKALALRLHGMFGPEHFYLEIQDHGIPVQKQVNAQLLRMARETGIPLVATNDVHYIEQADAQVQDVLLCIQTGRFLDEPDRMRMDSDQMYLKSEEEMRARFAMAPEAIENTMAIAQRCQVEMDFHTQHLPSFDVPEGVDKQAYLHALAEQGFAERYGQNQEVHARMEEELSIIASMGYVDYFLVVWDFIRFARENGIAVGPGRGSAAGSVVAYCLHITDVDPIQYGLIFERFLNPERVTMPDIDIDFCYERRQEVIDYVVQKYGADHVCQIITFGTMAARAAIRDVGRVMRMPYAEVDQVAKLVPAELGITLQRAIKLSPQLRRAMQEDARVAQLMDYAQRLEGMPRHSGTHAAGVVISREPLADIIPLQKNDDTVTTQFTMTAIEELGLLKMDFLGLRNLTVIQDACNLIEKSTGQKPDMSRIALDDPAEMCIRDSAPAVPKRSRGSGDTRFAAAGQALRHLLWRSKAPGVHFLPHRSYCARYRPYNRQTQAIRARRWADATRAKMDGGAVRRAGRGAVAVPRPVGHQRPEAVDAEVAARQQAGVHRAPDRVAGRRAGRQRQGQRTELGQKLHAGV